MKVIYEYKIDWGFNLIDLPVGSKILTARIYLHDEPHIFVLVDEYENRSEERSILVTMTDNVNIPDNAVYISTFESYCGDATYHIFEASE